MWYPIKGTCLANHFPKEGKRVWLDAVTFLQGRAPNQSRASPLPDWALFHAFLPGSETANPPLKATLAATGLTRQRGTYVHHQ